MRLLLDTHTVIWAAESPALLSQPALAAIRDPLNDRIVSAATLWEIAIKFGLRKLDLSLPYRQWITRALSDLRASLLPITVEYADAQSALPQLHRDPFDRMLAAQARVENIAIVSSDAVFDQYGVTRLW